ncbi:MerR family transcriptional regulator [Nocardia sp. NBC_00416]|uniref:MerR family transcriptional regulator n=1 Tax=Nocardia sp. NBC_00416 TaxID=2975991 RepID=UPI002E1A8BEC
MRIGELSHRTGVPERLLRYYEQRGLLDPVRRPGGFRDYRDSDIDTVRRIRKLLAAGLNTATIAAVLPCLRADEQRLVPTCPDLLADLRRERARITAAIADLEGSRTILDAVIDAAPGDIADGADRATAVGGRPRRFAPTYGEPTP